MPEIVEEEVKVKNKIKFRRITTTTFIYLGEGIINGEFFNLRQTNGMIYLDFTTEQDWRSRTIKSISLNDNNINTLNDTSAFELIKKLYKAIK